MDGEGGTGTAIIEKGMALTVIMDPGDGENAMKTNLPDHTGLGMFRPDGLFVKPTNKNLIFNHRDEIEAKTHPLYPPPGALPLWERDSSAKKSCGEKRLHGSINDPRSLFFSPMTHPRPWLYRRRESQGG